MDINKIQPTTKKQVKTIVEINNAIRVFDLALLYYNTSDLSWKKCIKKAQNTAVLNPMVRDW